jgi:tetratricopeptide (TPR) repeat protein
MLKKPPARLRAFFLCCPLFLLLAAFPAPHTLPNKKITTPQPDPAEQAFWKMDYRKADSLYSAELLANPANAEIYWKKARLEISIAEGEDYGKKQLQQLDFRKAEEYARKSVALDSTSSKGHAWLAASLGMMADNIGAKEKLKKAEEIKKQLDKALKLNPNDETALSILGSYYREAAGIGWFRRFMGNAFVGKMPEGNRELAEKAFRKAISIDPRIIRNYHELALLCIDTGRKQEAISLLISGLEKPVLFPSDRRRIIEMRSLMKELSEE